jgi:hypothetical protein
VTRSAGEPPLADGTREAGDGACACGDGTQKMGSVEARSRTDFSAVPFYRRAGPVCTGPSLREAGVDAAGRPAPAARSIRMAGVPGCARPASATTLRDDRNENAAFSATADGLRRPALHRPGQRKVQHAARRSLLVAFEIEVQPPPDDQSLDLVALLRLDELDSEAVR